ncbi:MAG TPA: glycine cleavage system aminomethyltransferase GcvT [Acidobacteriota bacterium]
MTQQDSALRRTPLYAAHLRSGARMVPFGGWEMPVQYSGVLEEHHAVRRACGLFDVSHMGEIELRGPDSLKLLLRLCANDAGRLEDGQVQYSALTTPEGTIVDDLLVYSRRRPEHYLLCVNASNTSKDFDWIQKHLEGEVDAFDRSPDFAQLAIQGPQAEAVLQQVLDASDWLGGLRLDALASYHFYERARGGLQAIVSRTGYTGEDGFEVYLSPELAEELWNSLLELGKPLGLLACGLGARDTLRLEAKLCLYGNDIDETTSVVEAGIGWILRFEERGDFFGRERLEREKPVKGRPERHPARLLVGFEMQGREIARHGYPVRLGGEQVDQVRSGAPGPSIGKNIGLAYLPWQQRRTGTAIEIEVRGRPARAQVVETPFYRRPRS